MGRRKSYRQPESANVFKIKRIYQLRVRSFDTVDHWIPDSKGGLHHEENLCVMAYELNQRKADKDPIEWAKEELENHQRYCLTPEIYWCELPGEEECDLMWLTECLTALPLRIGSPKAA